MIITAWGTEQDCGGIVIIIISHVLLRLTVLLLCITAVTIIITIIIIVCVSNSQPMISVMLWCMKDNLGIGDVAIKLHNYM